MTGVMAFDLTRLFLGPLSPSPRGIDRVDMALADFLFADGKSNAIGILPTPWGVRGFPAAMVQRGLEHLHHLWAERLEEDNDPLWINLVTALCGTTGSPKETKRIAALTYRAKFHRMWNHLRRTGVSLGQPVFSLPYGSIYLNIGQIGLALPFLHGWLRRRPDIASAFMLHDTIPIEYPHFVSPSAVTHHTNMVKTAVEYADLIITTTQHARETVTHSMAAMGRHDIPVLVRGLPLPEAFGTIRSADPALAGCHYFLTCSTVEPRKNHALLIEAWRRIIEQRPDQAPHLVIVGARGRHADAILGAITADAGLSRHVHHVAGLSSPSLARLMLGAAAMLCPSHAEGFGLSLLEGNALGLPTIASDIAAHREIANASTLLLPTDDPDAWMRAILACPPGHLRSTPAIPPQLSERAYCEDIFGFLRDFARSKVAAL